MKTASLNNIIPITFAWNYFFVLPYVFYLPHDENDYYWILFFRDNDFHFYADLEAYLCPLLEQYFSHSA